MRTYSKVLGIVFVVSLMMVSCTPEESAIYDTPLEIATGDEDQDVDDELEPNN